eukprot:GEMP01071070.1.p4 GENE.GEMP01071070.1~~GEMP01071070.1.p4  ORF type:complete len:107 (-),score=23.60 GEMP01071070.1:216-536(-)
MTRGTTLTKLTEARPTPTKLQLSLTRLHQRKLRTVSIFLSQKSVQLPARQSSVMTILEGTPQVLFATAVASAALVVLLAFDFLPIVSELLLLISLLGKALLLRYFP